LKCHTIRCNHKPAFHALTDLDDDPKSSSTTTNTSQGSAASGDVSSISRRKGKQALLSSFQGKMKQKVILKSEAEKEALTAKALYAETKNCPLSDFDKKEFRTMLEKVVEAGRVNGNFFALGAVKDRVFGLAHKARKLLKDRLQGKQATPTTDHWRSRAMDNYSALTIQWIENFKVHSAVLAVYVFKGLTNANKLVDDFIEKLNEWDLVGCVRFVVTDTEEAKMNRFG